MSEGIPVFGAKGDLPTNATDGDVAAVMTTDPPDHAPSGLLKAILPPAIPPFSADINHAWMMLGQKTQYEFELQSEMLNRAKETNGLHDACLAMTSRIVVLNDELASARTAKAELDAQVAEWQKIAQAAFEEKETELDLARKERDELRDELAVLKLHKETPSA